MKKVIELDKVMKRIKELIKDLENESIEDEYMEKHFITFSNKENINEELHILKEEELNKLPSVLTNEEVQILLKSMDLNNNTLIKPKPTLNQIIDNDKLTQEEIDFLLDLFDKLTDAEVDMLISIIIK